MPLYWYAHCFISIRISWPLYFSVSSYICYTIAKYLDTATIIELRSFIRLPYLMIWYFLKKMLLPVMNKWKCCLDNTESTTELVWDQLFILCLKEWIFVLPYPIWKTFHQMLANYTLRVCYTCWDIFGTKRTWDWKIMPR